MQTEERAFSEWLKQQRKALDLTQRELASQVGCSSVLIAKLESGQRRPSKQITTRLAQVLAIPQEQRAYFSLQARGTSIPSQLRSRFSLPSPPNPLIGRDCELERLLTLLQDPSVRLVTLIGLGGIGKTHLALTAGQQLGEQFVDGVFFVSLAAQADATHVPLSIAQALQLGPRIEQEPAQRLPRMLADKSVLLILDNFEQVLPAAIWIAELLAYCPQLRILATSRIPLQISGEHLISIEQLPIPAPDQSFIQAQSKACVALFVQRAKALRADFELTPHNLPAIIAICRQLEGIPLAIELVAAQSPILSPQMILQHLQATQSHALSLPIDGPRDLPARHRTLRATFDWGHALLDQTSRQLFAALSVFVDTIPFEAAVAVSGLESEQAYAHLHTLVQAHLLQAAHQEHGFVQFSMLETVRAYASECLDASQERAQVMRRFVNYYLDWTANYRPDRVCTDQARWFTITHQQRNNLQTALSWCSKHSLEQGAQLAVNLFWFWYMRGPWPQAEAWLSLFLEHGETQTQRGELMNALAGIAIAQGSYQTAELWAQRAKQLWNEQQQLRPLAYSLLFYGMALFRQSRSSEAYERLQESRRAFESAADGWGLAYALHSLRQCALSNDDLEQASELQNESLAHWRKLNDQWGIALALNGLGEIARLRGAIERAALLYQESLARLQSIADPIYSNVVTHNLAHIQLAQGRYAQAAQRFAQILYLDFQQGNHEILFWHIAGLAIAYAGQGELNRAARLCGFVQAWIETSGSLFDRVDQLAFDACQSQLRQQFDESEWKRFYQEGAGFQLSQAVEYALQNQSAFYKPKPI